jgi:hypothetical protein
MNGCNSAVRVQPHDVSWAGALHWASPLFAHCSQPAAPTCPAQIYQSEAKLVVDPKTVQITRGHFLAAMRALIPSSHRAASPYARAAPAHVMPLLKVSRAGRTRGWLMPCSVHHYHPSAPALRMGCAVELNNGSVRVCWRSWSTQLIISIATAGGHPRAIERDAPGARGAGVHCRGRLDRKRSRRVRDIRYWPGCHGPAMSAALLLGNSRMAQ